MTTSPICFIDTETTGLSLHDDIWEFAGIRLELKEHPEIGPLETADTLHLFIEHDSTKCRRLPDEFRRDHIARFPRGCSETVISRNRASEKIAEFTAGAHIIAAVPSFDTQRLETMFAISGNWTPKWHYHLMDVENLVVGYIAQSLKDTGLDPEYVEHTLQVITPPWNSEELSRAVGVEPTIYERHTAMGDVEWAMAMWRAVMG